MANKAVPRRGEVPHSPAAERALLGAALLDYPGLRQEGLRGLSAGDFFHPAHSLIWSAIERVGATGTPVGVITVCHALAEAGEIDRIDGLLRPDYAEPYLAGLWADCWAVSGAGAWAGIIREYAERRRAVERGSAIVRDAMNGKSAPTRGGFSL
jgi:replicative DNA helicase